ncbi:MAG: DUF420 domain-containing protein [Nitrospirae bacterium]|nr:MAG: DUF420 domain-containing protein [Nitrospirota bacterium]
MDLKTLAWYGVLSSITAAYLVAMAGARSARHHEVSAHARLMVRAGTIVGIWLVAYVTKQVLFGRDQFGGTAEQYWRIYVPILLIHTSLAATTIGLGGYNLYQGLTRLRYGSLGAMSSGMTLHRRLGKLLVWTFSGTMATAYLVYLLLFVWYSVA